MTKKNLCIFIADALRWDFLPKSIRKKGNCLPTFAHSLFTAPSIASLVTSLSPLNHNIKSFFDSLPANATTVFDLFPTSTYYDCPSDPMLNIVFRNVVRQRPLELEELTEPFVYVERMMETHIPYGKMHHGNDIKEIPKKYLGADYKNLLKKGILIPEEEYLKGVLRLEEHFWTHIETLKERGLFHNTLIVFTSDHGELLGERPLFKKRFTHNFPPCKELVTVPTVFINAKVNGKWMRTIDIVPTALPFLNKQINNSDGINVNEITPKNGINVIRGDIVTLWEFVDGYFRISYGRTQPKVILKILKQDFIAWMGDVFRHYGMLTTL